MKRCATCRYVVEVESGYFYCHRYAPRPGWAAGVTTTAVDWPGVDDDARCGEWRWSWRAWWRR